jgi:23S rRNA (cytosine1962-C5)-methyltransferase
LGRTDNGKVYLKPGAHLALRTGRPWVYRSELARVEGDPDSGDVVAVADAHGTFIAWAFYHRTSTLAARLLSRNPHEVVDDAFLGRRLDAAVAYRRHVLDPACWDEGGACRLVFAEADGLPGLVVDRYDAVLVLQVLSAGMERRLDALCKHLSDLTGIEDLFARDDSRVRGLEGLPPRVGPLRGHPPSVVTVREGDLRLEVDLGAGQKTGHFLDQRENRVRFGHLVEGLLRREGSAPLGGGRVLDAFCHTGGFGLQALAAGAASALFVDSQAAPLAAVGRIATANGLRGWSTLQANAFDVLRALARAGQQFAAVVLDPPAFARGKAQLPGAFRGYKEINLRAMRLLAPGGLLCTSSCSQAVSEAMFEEMLQEAAADAGRRLRVIGRYGAPPDHPGVLGAAETRYLKCFFLQAAD